MNYKSGERVYQRVVIHHANGGSHAEYHLLERRAVAAADNPYPFLRRIQREDLPADLPGGGEGEWLPTLSIAVSDPLPSFD